MFSLSVSERGQWGAFPTDFEKTSITYIINEGTCYVSLTMFI